LPNFPEQEDLARIKIIMASKKDANNLKFLRKGIAYFNLSLTNASLQKFSCYLTLLKELGYKAGLIGSAEERDIVKHFLDSLALLSIIRLEKGALIIDIGTGAGLPGIVLKIIRPDLVLTLVESSVKRGHLVEYFLANLKLKDVKVLIGRAEVLGHKSYLRERFDFAVARAVAKLPTLCELALPFVKVGGVFIAYKGVGVKLELEGGEIASRMLGGDIEELRPVMLPFQGVERCFVMVRKRKPTPEIYPRRVGIPVKRPLGSKPFKE
jgi:16S rRNA (guanine527-N7)-methyltransferase